MSEAPAAPLNRRARKRVETYQELIDVCRQLLDEGADLSLRAVAARMGMTSPGLYRYVDSVEALDALVAGAVLEDVGRDLAAVRERHPDDPAAQLVAAAARLRSWALTRSTEFRHVFTTPYAVMPQGGWQPVTIEQGGIARPEVILTRPFGEILAELTARGLVSVPGRAELDEQAAAAVQRSIEDAPRPWLEALGDDAVGTMWLLELAWARLYGVVTMEVFGLLDAATVESGVVFVQIVRETVESLGLGHEWARLKRVADGTGH